MANLQHVTAAQFKSEVLDADVPVLVDFYASWCGPCRMIAPALEQLAQRYEGQAKVVKVDVEQEPALAGQFRIQGVPTLLFFHNGKLVDSVVGAPSPAQLEQRLGAVMAA
jgi:thioredoxin 1